jgi:hypothetical protein
MTSAILGGLIAGLGTLAVSEVILRQLGAMLRGNFWKLLTLGAAIRTTWVLFVLTVVLSANLLEPRSFTISLMLGYLCAQMVEGVRYQRFFERQ